MSFDRINQIEKWANSSRPKSSNPAWMNTHSELVFVLSEHRKLQKEFFKLLNLARRACDKYAGDWDGDDEMGALDDLVQQIIESNDITAIIRNMMYD
jgi:hypothetical protein